MYTNEEIVEKIRELAKRKNTSLTDIEKNLAWSNGRIGKWKYAKKYPPKQDLELVARALKVSIETITGGQKEIPPTEKVDGMEEELIQIFRLLPDDLKAGILAQIKAVLVQRGLLPSQSE